MENPARFPERGSEQRSYFFVLSAGFALPLTGLIATTLSLMLAAIASGGILSMVGCGCCLPLACNFASCFCHFANMALACCCLAVHRLHFSKASETCSACVMVQSFHGWG